MGKCCMGSVPRRAVDPPLTCSATIRRPTWPSEFSVDRWCPTKSLSALIVCQTRQVSKHREGVRQACRYNLIDSLVALNIAFFINAAEFW